MSTRTEKQREYSRAYRARNPEKVKENARRHREKNREIVREQQRLHKQRKRAEDPEFFRKYHSEYHIKRKTDVRAVTLFMVGKTKKRAFEKGWKFDLDQHFDELAERIGRWKCELSGVTLEVSIGSKKINSLSLDRIDSRKGYTIDNVRVIAWGLNAAFSDWGEAETAKLMRRYLDRLELL